MENEKFVKTVEWIGETKTKEKTKRQPKKSLLIQKYEHTGFSWMQPMTKYIHFDA